MERLISVSGRVFQWIAKENFPTGSVIRCVRCNVKRNCTTSEIAEWMTNGFPCCKKCGTKTQLDNPYQRSMQ